MLLIGFIWVFIGMAAAMVARPLVGGRWEDSGPAAMLTASAGAVMMVDGPNGFGPPLAESMVGIIGSLVGGAIGFFGFVFDAKRAATAVS